MSEITNPAVVAEQTPQTPTPSRASTIEIISPEARRGGNRKRALRMAKDANKRRGANSKFKKRGQTTDTEFDSKVIEVRRVTRVVKGGKRMRFSALVVVGNKDGKLGYAIKKGLDYQDAVSKATRRAKLNLITVSIDENLSLAFESKTKFKSIEIYLKPAKNGTGLIAGGFIRPVLELAGVRNIYSKIIRSRNKISGTQAVFEALKKYSVKSKNIEKVVETAEEVNT